MGGHTVGSHRQLVGWRGRAGATALLAIGLIAVGCAGDAEHAATDQSPATVEVQTVESEDGRGLILTSNAVAPGYLVYSPLSAGTTYVVDGEGRVVHTWQRPYAPGSHLYLYDNGDLLRGGRDPEATSFRSGGVGGYIERVSWDGELLWSWRHSSAESILHHDIEPLPNGNILALAWEVKSPEEAAAVGRRPDLVPEQGVWPDWIFEIEPLGSNDARIVWEWHVWDHLVQDYDPEAANYGDPAEHPRRLDVNVDEGGEAMDEEELEQLKALGYVPDDATPQDLASDFLHVNAVEYNAELDQIALSVPVLGEVWIIDHSTTTEEAAGSTGGRYGHGGDLLYRWGNPQVYGRGTAEDQQLFYQHDVQWIPEGFDGAGSLTLFNNGGGRPNDENWSEVMEVAPPRAADGSYPLPEEGPWGPAEPTWTYEDQGGFFAPFISGATRLANGNTVVCAGPMGRFFEVDRSGTIVWEFLNPFSGDMRLVDGTVPQPGIDQFPFATFRVQKIAPDHPALEGRELKPLDPQPKRFVPPPEEEATGEDGEASEEDTAEEDTAGDADEP